MKKKILSFALVISILASLFVVMPITANAEKVNGIYFSIENEQVTITGCDSSITELEIPDTIEGYPVTAIAESAFRNRSNLTKITIPDSVVTIGSQAFYNCDFLTSVIIGDGVTTIGEYAFYSCSKAEITLSDSVETIGNYAFYDCDSLAEINIPAGVKTIGNYAFNDCGSLTNINVDSDNPNYCSVNGNLFNKDKTTLIQYAVGKNDATYIIPASVTTIGEGAFSDCSNVTVIAIPDSVTEIGGSAFSYCNNLTRVTIGSGVKTIGGGAFAYCDNLTIITIPDNVETIGYRAFFDCDSLASVTIGNGVKTIGENAFEQCYGLAKVTMGNCVETIGNYAFYECRALTSITIPDSVTSIGEYAFYECNNLARANIGNGVTTIGKLAFYSCDILAEVNMGNSVTTIGNSAFQGCSNLKSIELPESVMFVYDYAFSGCTGLTKAGIPGNVVRIEKYAFSGCQSLTDLDIAEGVIVIRGFAFSGCTSLESVTFPDSLTSINNLAFSGCSNLAEITFGKEIEYIGGRAFSDSPVTDVYYNGTRDEWSTVYVEDSNDSILNATMHYAGEMGHDHQYGEWVTDEDTHKKTCECGNIIEGDHEWNDGETVTPATHTQDGAIVYTCVVCEYTKQEVIPADRDAHEYSEWEIDEDTHKKACECGSIIEGAHQWDAGVVTTKPTYTKDGVKTYTCEVCDTTRTEVIEKLPVADSDTAITVGAVKAKGGQEITVPVSISNNVGLTGLQLSCGYDADVLTLTGVEAGEALNGLEFSNTTDLGENPIVLLWDGMDADDTNGNIAILKFVVADNAQVGTYPISIDVQIACDQDLNDVPVNLENGSLEVVEYTMGDANSDGGVDVKDVIALRRYITDGYAVAVFETAADVTHDGKVDVKDIIVLRRFITGGYGVELEY